MRSIVIILLLLVSGSSIAQTSKKIFHKAFTGGKTSNKLEREKSNKVHQKNANTQQFASKHLKELPKSKKPLVSQVANVTKGKVINKKEQTQSAKKESKNAVVKKGKKTEIVQNTNKKELPKNRKESIKANLAGRKDTKRLQKAIEKQLKLFAKVRQPENKKTTVSQKAKKKIDAKEDKIDAVSAITLAKQEDKKIYTKKEKQTKSLVLYTPFMNDWDGEILQHFGKIKISNVYYNNTSVTYVTDLNMSVYSTIDSAIVSEISYNEDSVATVFLKYEQYTIIIDNLKNINTTVGSLVLAGTLLGYAAEDEMHKEYGAVELMLMRGNKILNPEKYLKPRSQAQAVTTPTQEEEVEKR